MKTPVTILLLVAACAASGYAGYYFGQNHAAENTASAATAAKHEQSANAKVNAELAALANKPSLASLLKGPGVPDADTLAEWAKTLTPTECADLLKQLQAAKGGLVRDTVLEAVLKSWAKSDPKAMLGAMDQVKSPRLREAGADLALKTWATQDPATAMKWIKDNPGTASTAANQARYDAVIAGFAATDPKGAFDAVNAMADGNDRDRQDKVNALQAITDTLAQSGKFSDAQQLLANLPAGTTHDEAMDHFAESWASYSPEDATAWASAVTDPAERSRLEGRVVDSWAASDPIAAATWAAQTDQQAIANADPNAPKDPLNGPGMLLANAIVAWSQDDLDGPANFLNQMPNSPAKDRSVAIFAMHASEEDPQGATKWLDTITDNGVRQGVTTVVLMNMYQQDPNMANDYIANNQTMTDQEKQSMQQMLPVLGLSMAALKSMSGQGGDPMSNIMESVLTGKSNPMMTALRQRAGQQGGLRGVPAQNNQPPPQPANQ